jgi:hypothetical protein
MQIPTVFFFWGAQIEESIAKKEPKYNHLTEIQRKLKGNQEIMPIWVYLPSDH